MKPKAILRLGDGFLIWSDRPNEWVEGYSTRGERQKAGMNARKPV